MKKLWRLALMFGFVIMLNAWAEEAEAENDGEGGDDSAIAVDPKAGGSATVPVSRMEVPKDAKWYPQRHNANVKEMEKGKAKFLMIGDSITHIWEAMPVIPKNRCPGHPELVKKYFGKYMPINLGFSGDQTQNVLWRLDNLPLDKITPQVAMIMIGTNNLSRNTPEQIATGVVMIIKKLKDTYPDIKILQLAVFPRAAKATDPARAKVAALNAAIEAKTKDIENVQYLDIGDVFLEKDGSIAVKVFYDFLHPDKEGYDRWGKAVAPHLEKMFKDK